LLPGKLLHHLTEVSGNLFSSGVLNSSDFSNREIIPW
jgi:hypothetical protein